MLEFWWETYRELKALKLKLDEYQAFSSSNLRNPARKIIATFLREKWQIVCLFVCLHLSANVYYSHFAESFFNLLRNSTLIFSVSRSNKQFMGKKCQEEQIQSNSNRRITTFLIVFVDIFIYCIVYSFWSYISWIMAHFPKVKKIT